LWHGANWTFIVWGALHGIYNVVGIWTADAQSAFFKFLRIDRFPLLLKWLNRSIVFVLVSFAWIFFRAESLSHAQAIIAKLFAQEYPLHLNAICADRGPLNLGLSFFVIGILGISYLLPTQLKLRNSVAFLALTIFVIILLGKNVAAEFIYFQF
jgi:D-alanyl-lipoteichoic acid acyltransferase DltB (MBOAT superfamily)